MRNDFILPRVEVSHIVSRLMDKLTPNDELEPRVEDSYEGNYVHVEVSFDNPETFRTSIVMNDNESMATVNIFSLHKVVSGVPDVRPNKYLATVPGDRFAPVKLYAGALTEEEMFDELVPRVLPKYRKALTRALQVLIEVEKGLSRKFYS